MIQFAQPIVSLLLGMALAIYGTIHAASHVPPPEALYLFWQSLPGVSSVLLFLLGSLPVISGLWLLTSGAQGLRKRQRQIERMFAQPREPYDDDRDYHPHDR